MSDRDANCLEEVLAGLIVRIWWWSCCSKCIKLDEQDWMRNGRYASHLCGKKYMT